MFNFGRSHFYGHIADTFNLIRLSRFAEQNRGGYLPTAALLRNLQWVSDVCAQHASYPRHDKDLTKLCRISSFPY